MAREGGEPRGVLTCSFVYLQQWDGTRGTSRSGTAVRLAESKGRPARRPAVGTAKRQALPNCGPAPACPAPAAAKFASYEDGAAGGPCPQRAVPASPRRTAPNCGARQASCVRPVLGPDRTGALLRLGVPSACANVTCSAPADRTPPQRDARVVHHAHPGSKGLCRHVPRENRQASRNE